MDKLPTTFPSTGATARFFWTILPTPLWLKMRSALQPHGRPSWERFPEKKRKSGCCMMLLRWLVDIFRVYSVNTMEQVYIHICV